LVGVGEGLEDDVPPDGERDREELRVADGARLAEDRDEPGRGRFVPPLLCLPPAPD
jgi:hypothetical protein